MALAAQNEKEAVIRGEDYTIRSHMDGSKTVTFYSDLDASDTPSEETEIGPEPNSETVSLSEDNTKSRRRTTENGISPVSLPLHTQM